MLADVLVATTGSQEDKKRKVLDADVGRGDGDDRVNRKEEQIEPPPPTKKQKVTEEQEEQEPENDRTALSVSAKSNNGTDGIEAAKINNRNPNNRFSYLGNTIKLRLGN